MVIPCTLKSRLYWSTLRKVFCGYINWTRISSAAMPAITKNAKPVKM